MLAIGDLFLKKSEYGGRVIRSIIAIAEDHEGTKLYEVGGQGCFTETQLYDQFDSITMLEGAETIKYRLCWKTREGKLGYDQLSPISQKRAQGHSRPSQFPFYSIQ